MFIGKRRNQSPPSVRRAMSVVMDTRAQLNMALLMEGLSSRVL